MSAIEIKVPDIGDFKDVPIIEVLVKVGDTVTKEQSLITVESDKATMEIPSPEAGVITSLSIKLGDVVNTGVVIGMIEVAGAGAAAPVAKAAAAPAAAPASAAAAAPKNAAPTQATNGSQRQSTAHGSPQPAPTKASGPTELSGERKFAQGDLHAEVLVLGAGPGGYTAAFRSADLGTKVVLIEIGRAHV